jgi:hypothetical protein
LFVDVRRTARSFIGVAPSVAPNRRGVARHLEEQR